MAIKEEKTFLGLVIQTKKDYPRPSNSLVRSTGLLGCAGEKAQVIFLFVLSR